MSAAAASMLMFPFHEINILRQEDTELTSVVTHALVVVCHPASDVIRHSHTHIASYNLHSFNW
jgi:hypothetical protein